MKIILLKDVQNVGRKNEVKEVSGGFARNFLFASNLAKPATEANVHALDHAKAQTDKKQAEETLHYKKLVDTLQKTKLHFKIKIGEKGKAFGSITVAKIHEELRRHKIDVQKDWIDLPEPIKTLGEKIISVRLPHNTSGEFRIIIEPDEQ